MSRNGYKPIDNDSARIARTDRCASLLMAALVASMAVTGIVNLVQTHEGMSPSANLDAMFGSLLIDEQGFYFPMQEYSTIKQHRYLKKKTKRIVTTFNAKWGMNWKKNLGGNAAVGEYYRAKAIALEDFYYNQHQAPLDPNVTQVSVSDSNNSEMSIWTADWQADKERGLNMAQAYRSIGDTIDQHYRKGLDDTYRKYVGDNIQHFRWKDDADLGLALAQHYKQLANQIYMHYILQYLPVGPQETWSPEKFQDYKEKGLAVAEYYRSIAKNMGDFYRDEFHPMATMDSSNNSNLLDPISLRKEMKEKGLAIQEYYRAKYDPTYETNDNNNSANYPPWGQDPNADKVRGKAIADYYKKRGKAMGRFYSQHGRTIGQYYQNYFRSIFDPSYNVTTIANDFL